MRRTSADRQKAYRSRRTKFARMITEAEWQMIVQMRQQKLEPPEPSDLLSFVKAQTPGEVSNRLTLVQRTALHGEKPNNVDPHKCPKCGGVLGEFHGGKRRCLSCHEEIKAS
jgi:hypothetical protein